MPPTLDTVNVFGARIGCNIRVGFEFVPTETSTPHGAKPIDGFVFDIEQLLNPFWRRSTNEEATDANLPTSSRLDP